MSQIPMYNPPPRRDRDVVAVVLMGVAVVGVVATLFAIAPLAGVLASFATIGAIGAVLGMSGGTPPNL